MTIAGAAAGAEPGPGDRDEHTEPRAAESRQAAAQYLHSQTTPARTAIVC